MIDHPATGMSSKQQLMLTVALALVLGNTAGIFWLSQKIDQIQKSGVSIERQTQAERDSPPRFSRSNVGVRSSAGHSKLPLNRQIEIASEKIARNRIGRDFPAPAEWSRELDSLQVREQTNGAVESKNTQSLNEFARKLEMERKVPMPKDFQATCQGRRCTIYASFSDETSARNWSTRYLLSTGDSVFSRSKTAIIRSDDSSQTTLKLYLY